LYFLIDIIENPTLNSVICEATRYCKLYYQSLRVACFLLPFVCLQI